MSRHRLGCVLAMLVVAVSTSACAPSPLPPPAPIVTTLSRPLGSWAGRSGFQTEFFFSEHGRFRVRWEARVLSPGTAVPRGGTAAPPPPGSPPEGRALATTATQEGVRNPDEVGPYFELKLQSGVSGRQLGEAVERRTSGKGTLEFNEDPRDFYFAVRAHDMEWSFHVEEFFVSQILPSAASALNSRP